MKILVLIHEFPPIGGGGGPIARDLSFEWAKAGHEVRVVTAHFGDLPERETIRGVEVIRLKSGRTESFRAKMKAMAGYVAAAAKYCLFDCKDFQPDVIHVHFAVPAGPAAMIASKALKAPYVITAHLGDIPGASPEKTGKWFKYILPFTPPIWKKAAAVVAVSEYSRRMALKTYDVPIEVIPNGIRYDEVKNEHVEMHEVPEIVFAGRFVPQKNLLQIVRTLSTLKDLSWHCTLIGDGEVREEIEKAIHAEGLEERFSLPGWKTPEEVISIFHQSDILFLPSLYEGLPVTGIQAMASGLALELSNAGGNPEIVREGETGFIHEPQDTAGYAADLRMLLSDPERLLQMRRKCAEAAKAFDMRLTAEKYIGVFQRVIKR